MTMFLMITLHKLRFVDLVVLADAIGEDRIQMLWQWCMYFSVLSFFHLMEFFTTALFNAEVVSADSYLVNHSTTYTFAALFSWTEFATRFIFAPNWNNASISIVGFGVVVVSQVIRSLAMITCGASFNHMIQREKKENHVLITHGVYRYLRHPSYFGFYYWSIGVQLILNNTVAGCLSAIASSIFFRRRIPYEEQSLVCHFEEEYVEFAKRAYIGIPFVPTRTVLPEENNNNDDDAKQD
eukprot:CAMPEP_0119566362 /NCGR_PEP_ID=MMETSP1352-20130426/32838_1 /TAXON_ID=265584 /ORGANISM="Stauroneis constricta, Strain CCMP1120" /LENGTH=238 /DNA_ID=CAMNT_0007615457 /DNA_START=76 /DNA_END=792 /DNA_ORIENTATION=-